MPINVRIELSPLATTKPSGVGAYTKLLALAIQANPRFNLYGHYFNFLHRQIDPVIPGLKLRPNILFPLRIYAKLQSLNIAPWFDFFLPKADVTIHPNFALWPSLRSKLNAVVIHDLTYIYYPEVVERKNLSHLRRVVPRALKKADFIITISESIKEEIIQNFKIDPDKFVVTPIPPASEFFEESSKNMTKKYNIPTEKYIYFIGTLEPRKNLITLVRAYRNLPQEIKDEYSLVIAGGKGWNIQETEREVTNALNMGDNIVQLGYIPQSDSPALMQQASLYIMPSLYEGFGMPVTEAMAAKTPVLCSDIPVLREVGGDAFAYAKTDSPDDFTQKISQILLDKTLQETMINKGVSRIAAISWYTNSELLYKKIAELLDRRSS